MMSTAVVKSTEWPRQTGGVAQGAGQVRFAQAHAAHEDHVGFVREKGQAEEVLDLGAVDFLGPVPVELVEGFDAGEAGGGDAALDGQLLPALGFAVDEPGQIIHMRPLFLGRFAGQSRVVLLHGDQP